ncbi:MAG: aquaporin [Gemmatimonadales bacterium]
MASLWRRLVAEAFGTFGLVFVGSAVVVVNAFPNAAYGILGIAVAHAFVLAIMITVTMNISGGHLNPAVTFGLLVARKIDLRTALPYIAAQLAGAVLGALLVKYAIPSNVGRVLSYGTPVIASSITLGQAITIEAVLTFFLVSAFFGTLVSPDAPKVGGFGVGLVLLFAILVGGPLTGAALNPARAFGPALVSGNWLGQAVWWVGPLLGALAAGLLWKLVLLPPEKTQES